MGLILKRKGSEISVKKASQLLNLSERTVLNFIKQKKIIAIKVGRDWFIDYASFVSFSEKYEFEMSNVSEGSDVLSEKFGKVPKDSETIRNVSEISETLGESNKVIIPLLSSSLKRVNHLSSLRVYELSRVIFTNKNFSNVPTSKIEERAVELFHQTLESIGAGFYAYSWDEKKFYYSRARSSAGGLMALISTGESILTKWKKEGHELKEFTRTLFRNKNS